MHFGFYLMIAALVVMSLEVAYTLYQLASLVLQALVPLERKAGGERFTSRGSLVERGLVVISFSLRPQPEGDRALVKADRLLRTAGEHRPANQRRGHFLAKL